MTSNTEFETVELSDEERGIELIGTISTFTDYREFLRANSGDTFRLKHTDEIEFADLQFMRAKFLIEEEESMGRPTDWTPTERADYLDSALPDDFEISPDEANALLKAGTDVFELPPASAPKWRMRATDAYIDGPRLGVLCSADLIESVDRPTGHPVRWKTSERLDEIRAVLGGIVYA